MANEFDTSNTVEVRTPSQVNTTKGRVDTFLIDRENSFIAVRVSFGVGDPLEIKLSELWYISGDFYNMLIGATPTGNSLGLVLHNGGMSLVKYVQDTPGRRDTLIASGELKVTSGGLLDLIR